MSDLQVRITRHFGMEVSPPGRVFHRQVQADYTLTWIIEGSVEWRLNGEAVPVPAGAMLLTRPGVTPHYHYDRRQCTREGFIIFEVLQVPDDWPPDTAWPMLRMVQSNDILVNLFEHVLACRGKVETSHICRVTTALLSAFVNGFSGRIQLSSDHLPAPVHLAITYIQDRLYESPRTPVTLAQLAEAACVTHEHLCRAFKTSTGKTPSQTIRAIRLDRARMLLEVTKLPIREVTEECGFTAQPHFSRVFKEAFGESPSEYRSRTQTGTIPLRSSADAGDKESSADRLHRSMAHH